MVDRFLGWAVYSSSSLCEFFTMNETPLLQLQRILGEVQPYRAESRRLCGEVRTLTGGLLRHARLGPEGPLVVMLFGGANTGKSTIFNALVRQELSPVGPIAGTTRHVLVHAPSSVASILEDRALWPESHPPVRLARREDLIEEKTPRDVFLSIHDDTRLESLVLMDSPDMTTAYQENAKITAKMLLLTDVALLVLTEEQHADQVLIDHFSILRDLGKKVLALFNRVPLEKVDALGASQKFRLVWLENRMGDLPERFYVPRVPAGGGGSKLALHPAVVSLFEALGRLDRKALLAQTRAGLGLALRRRGAELLELVQVEHERLTQAVFELDDRYRGFLSSYNARRRWASRMLEIRSFLASTFRTATGSPGHPSSEGLSDSSRERAFRTLLSPLVAQSDRPCALEGLELMGEALEYDPTPAPMFRPFTRLAKGVHSLLYGSSLSGEANDPASLTDALELLESERCRFVAQEVLPKTLGPEWMSALSEDSTLPHRDGSIRTEPFGTGGTEEVETPLRTIAQGYRALCDDLTRTVRKLVEESPGIRDRMSRRHARLALTAGIAGALALIDMGHSALAVVVGLGAPALFWELMDWAMGRPELNEALDRFAKGKARWMEQAYFAHVTGGVRGRLENLISRNDPEDLKLALRHCDGEDFS